MKSSVIPEQAGIGFNAHYRERVDDAYPGTSAPHLTKTASADIMGKKGGEMLEELIQPGGKERLRLPNNQRRFRQRNSAVERILAE
ncbi:unnamed protein product [Angiostrongylus costaricensis]|uniref:Uncharacterized protein n=1 Tax=Angiostrongylus costaricensis TaxID=334426 RepID=A0A0R3Q2L4_ANGCS|nr:unnamed protein product [Angiostrongylus costaricensis]